MSESLPDLLGRDEAVLDASSDHKPVQALSIDPSGARMVTGGVDGILKYWEFTGMNGVDPKPFRELMPVEGHPIVALSYNSNGSLVLCVTSDARARVFDREGTQRAVEETIKGDQYIRTPENTKGHTHNLSYGEFHPRESNRFMTSSYDSTVRLWDLHTKRIGMDQNIPNLNCFKCVDARNVCGGNKMYVSTACYSSDGSQVMAGCSDGSLHLFHEKNRYGKGLSIVRSAHMGAEITAVRFLFEDTQLVSRGTDDCVRFWDVRKFKEPVRTWTGIETARSLSNMALSPDSQWLLMGTGKGAIAAVDLSSGELVGERKKFNAPQLIRTEWNSVLNQIFSTSVDGNIFINYSETESKGGALSFVHKQPSAHKALHEVAPVSASSVFAYDELIDGGEYRENKLGEIRQVTQKPRIPKAIDVFATGDSRSVLTALEKRKRGLGEEGVDIQHMLSSASDGRPSAVASMMNAAYGRTQPERVLDYSDTGHQIDQRLQSKTYCPRCGLKICTCGYMSRSGQATGSQPMEGPQVTIKRAKPS